MPKRFTETEKWKDKWFRALKPEYKLAWIYLLDNCDIAGVIDIDEDLANFQIGEEVEWAGFYAECGNRIKRTPKGKVFVVRFVEYQYGKLSHGCRPHIPVIAKLKAHGIELDDIPQNESFKSERVSEKSERVSERVSDTLQEQEQEQEQEKDKDQEQDQEQDYPETPIEPRPKHSPRFAQVWNLWKKHLRETHKPLAPAAEEVQLMNLGRCFATEEERIGAVLFSIERQARNLITNGDHKRQNESRLPGGVAGPDVRRTQRAPTDLTGVFD